MSNPPKTPGSNGVWGKSGSSISAVKAPPAPTSSLSAAVSASSSTSFKTPPGRGGGRGNSSSSGGRGIGGGGRTSHNSHGGGGSGFSKTPGGKYGGGASTPNHNTPSNRKTPQDGKRLPPNKHNNHATSPASGVGGGKASSGAGGKKPQRASNKSLDDIELLHQSSETVKRIPASQFFACRMQYLEALPATDIIPVSTENKEEGESSTTSASDHHESLHLSWTPHPFGHWVSDSRIQEIQDEMSALLDFVPLQVNNETRWKPKVIIADEQKRGGTTSPTKDTKDGDISADEEEQLRQAFAILNKLSWTTLDKLTVLFLRALGVGNSDAAAAPASLSKDVVTRVMTLLVDKAMLEPHFGELYARFALKLSSVHKAFKRTLLALCQELFEVNDAAALVELPSDMDLQDREMEELKIRKKSIGLMQFIGELYHVGLIRGDIMVECLERLLQPDDEERLDCFCKLMTTIGSKLHDDKTEQVEAMQTLWKLVYCMAGSVALPDGPKAPSVRVKFLLQDLVELKENGWEHRRKQEKAKSLKEIHKDVAQEEAAAQRRASQQGSGAGGIRKSSSQSSMTKSLSSGGFSNSSASPVPTVPTQDDEGFVSVAKPKRNSSRRNVPDASPVDKSVTDSKQRTSVGAGPRTSLQLAMEGKTPGKDAYLSSRGTPTVAGPPPTTSVMATPVPISIQEYLDPAECGKRGKSLLKEYLISGDIDDAVLTVDEIICLGKEGHEERGAAMIEESILTMLEMKQADVDKLLKVFEKTIIDKKISHASLVKGLQTPLVSFRDIEIDAPLAAQLLAGIFASWMRLGAVPLQLLQSCPDTFLNEARPAEFACLTLAKRGGSASDSEIAVVEGLMSDEEKSAHPSVPDWLASYQA